MMACEVDRRKCFTFIWKIENADYWLQPDTDNVSPTFTVEEIQETKWKLLLYFVFGQRYGNSSLFLLRQADKTGADNVEIDYELAYLASDGTVLHSFEEKHSVIEKLEEVGFEEFPSWDEVFSTRRSVFLPQDTLTVRCRMWKSVGEISKSVQCCARTCTAVEKRSDLWNIRDFSTLRSDSTQIYDFKSLETGKQFMRLEFFLTERLILDETIGLKIIPDFENIITATLQLSIVDACRNAMKCFQDEFLSPNCYDDKEFILFYSKKEFMEEKSAYLPNDVLSLLCECAFCLGPSLEEIESASSNCLGIVNKEYNGRCLNKANELLIPTGILIDDFKSLLNNSILSDVKLKTRSKTYPAHKCILSIRSPVFKAMFSNDMRENIKDCVDIEDLSDDTVLHMLRYLYTADVEGLEWGRAMELYGAADKYHILNLKDVCSSYLKGNLCPNNACEALVLSDLHQDENLKHSVQNFILRHGKEIINSEHWKQLMETDLKLAVETMCLKYKE